MRRQFYDLIEADHSLFAIEGVERIAALYAIEEEIQNNLDSVTQALPAGGAEFWSQFTR
jgi:hypothetical protein